ncbi:MAG: hypothetical protein RIT02_2329 [Planctomycetota bacterium]|jgi:uncharacterized membrane protein
MLWLFAAINMICLYLAARFLRLHTGRVRPGTSLCSWTAYIDCDQVLLTREARYFVIPNALLGLTFNLAGTAVCIMAIRSDNQSLWLLLACMYTVSAAVTAVFWKLLLRLPSLCPLCPLHHFLTYIILICCLAKLQT